MQKITSRYRYKPDEYNTSVSSTYNKTKLLIIHRNKYVPKEKQKTQLMKSLKWMNYSQADNIIENVEKDNSMILISSYEDDIYDYYYLLRISGLNVDIM